MEIRLLHSLEDAEKYRNIRLEALKTTPEAYASSYEEEIDLTIEEIKSKFHEQDTYTYGGFDGEELIGIITLYHDRLKKLRHRAHLGGMYVSPHKRDLGMGKALMKEAINKAKSIDGIEQIYLAVVSTNVAAKKLYQSIGFEVFGTEKRGLLVGNDVYYDVDFMILYL